MGIEFCYAAETAFVSPILLNFGLSHTHMTLIWCLSPLLGFFLTPSLGVLSDNCTLKIGRRRPFIFILSIGIILGLILVPNGRDFGITIGDTPQIEEISNNSENALNISTVKNSTNEKYATPLGLLFTVIGTVLLDFDADACQSPARAYLLDVTLPEDHAKGLSTFTIMAGMGGAMGYMLGGIHWSSTIVLTTSMLASHVQAVFTTILIIYIICLITTLCSYREKPLMANNETSISIASIGTYMTFKNEEIDVPDRFSKETSGMKRSNSAPNVMKKSEHKSDFDVAETSFTITDIKIPPAIDTDEDTLHSTRQYFYSIIHMPSSLRIVCLTNVFSWMSLVCYSLYFTDFVGEAIFKGNPRAPAGSSALSAYENGVQFACWGMAIYSLSCSVYSLFIDKLIDYFGTKSVYIGGQLIYSFGMAVLAIARHPAASMILSCTAGIMYSTLFTMPYLLVSHYHSNLIIFENTDEYRKRGLGTDVAIVGSMVFVAQLILSLCIGSLVNLAGSTVIVICIAAFLSLCGAISATQVVSDAIKYSTYLRRPNSRLDLIRISAVVMGIEFCNAAETAFVSPILLNFGLSHSHMTLVWCLSPLLGFFLTPSLGALSDNCTFTVGRRRPFVFIFSIGIVMGLIFVSYGRNLGNAFGDTAQNNYWTLNVTENALNISTTKNLTNKNYASPLGLLFTIIGIALLDFDTDACQSPARAYLLDVTLPEDHAKGLSTFTIMAGMGGAMGYVLGGVPWSTTVVTSAMLANHIRAVFTIILIIYIICLIITLCSYREKSINADAGIASVATLYMTFKKEEIEVKGEFYKEISSTLSAPKPNVEIAETDTQHSMRHYFYSIIHMPSSLKIVCLTNVFSWMSLVCYSLYFTDFVGEAIFKGNPRAPAGSSVLSAYENGVQFACWGMAIYSLSCSVYSLFIDKLISYFGTKSVYIGGQLTYSFGMALLAMVRHPIAALILSCTTGVMYSTLLTIPYLLVSHYHTDLIFIKKTDEYKKRGLGTDIAIVSSMVFVAQLILSVFIGSLVNLTGSTVIVVCIAALFSFGGAISATQVFYSTL
uniref:Major facilitator superfamily (MFS) profile domain-containing protein n=1 Tax=Strigamia maritima TaxID=126957 RepID=T1IUZ2_STRMM